MSSDGTIPSQRWMEDRGLPALIPRFAELAHGSVFRRMGSNLAACFSASPTPVGSWQFAWMFRSAHLRRSFPTRPLLESILLHVAFLTFLISEPLPRSSPLREASPVEVARVERRIIWYTRNDRLPPISPLETKPPVRKRPPSRPAAVRLAFHPTQTIISKPPRPDNPRQTIVQPEAPRLQLPNEVRIPNIVAWAPPLLPPPPSVAEGQKQVAQVRVPKLPVPVVSAPIPVPPKLNLPEVPVPDVKVSELPKAPVPPPPVVAEAQQQLAQIRVPKLPVPVVSAPTPVPPKLNLPEAAAPEIKVSELPKLPLPPAPVVAEAQQQLAQIRVPRVPTPSVSRPVPLPPEFTPTAEPTALPTLVAVGVAPAPPPEREEVSVPLGNRSGDFAVSPEGSERTERTSAGSARPGTRRTREEPRLPQLDGQPLADIRVPDLLVVGDKPPVPAPPEAAKPPEPRAVRPPTAAPSAPPAGDIKALLARAKRPSLLPEMTRGKTPAPGFFGNRRVYTVSINMPNLSSGAGSWILRFAENGDDGAGAQEDGEISSPVAVKKVDPQYVPAAVRDRIEGSVTLAAQIGRDGTVSNVSVVRGLDPRLDLSAVQALSLWQFQPAHKKGVPIDLEVLVQIPFRLPAF